IMTTKKINKVHKEVNDKIEILNGCIESGSYDEIQGAFDEFIDSFVKIGSYNKITWSVTWTRRIWDYSEELAKYQHISSFIVKIKQRLINSDLDEKEPLEFLLLELQGAVVNNINLIKKQAIRCANEYPYNIEFVQILAHALMQSKKKSDNFEAIHHYRKCVVEWGGAYNDLIKYLFNKELSIFKKTLSSGEYLEAEKQLDHIMSFTPYQKNPLSQNTMLIFKDRLMDRKHTEAINAKTTREIKESIKEEYSSQSKKNIEQLGVFSAVITFIITAAASAFNSKNENVPLLIMAIGLILILFMSTISLFNEKDKKFFSDYRFYIVIGYLMLSFYTVKEYKTILSLVKTEHT
ncbi:TPA: hypothetical protein ACF35C_004645, partial [Vibrio parahaemolyticus]|nr:hypothetical protein [Vibrio parahaemolyticus]